MNLKKRFGTRLKKLFTCQKQIFSNTYFFPIRNIELAIYTFYIIKTNILKI